jgi:hypothetical protein
MTLETDGRAKGINHYNYISQHSFATLETLQFVRGNGVLGDLFRFCICDYTLETSHNDTSNAGFILACRKQLVDSGSQVEFGRNRRDDRSNGESRYLHFYPGL